MFAPARDDALTMLVVRWMRPRWLPWQRRAIGCFSTACTRVFTHWSHTYLQRLFQGLTCVTIMAHAKMPNTEINV